MFVVSWSVKEKSGARPCSCHVVRAHVCDVSIPFRRIAIPVDIGSRHGNKQMTGTAPGQLLSGAFPLSCSRYLQY